MDNALKGLRTGDTAAAAAVTDTNVVKTKEAQNKAQTLFEGKEAGRDTAAGAAESTAAGAKKEEAITSFSELLSGIGEQIGVLESNKAKVEKILARKDVRDALERSGLGGSNFLWGHETQRGERRRCIACCTM